MLRANAPWVVLKGGTSTWHHGCGLLLVRLFTGCALVLRDGVLWWVGWIGGLVVVVSGTLLGPEGTSISSCLGSPVGGLGWWEGLVASHGLHLVS